MAFLRISKTLHVRLEKKTKKLVFTRVHVCVKAKLTLVEVFPLFFAPFPNLKSSSLESESEFAGSSKSLERETLGTELELSLKGQN